MSHKLKLIPDALGLSDKELVIRDYSQYDSEIAIQNGYFQLVMPGIMEFIPISGFVARTGIVLNSEKLGITEVGEAHVAIPDGLYVMNYSVSPNAKVNTTIRYYRTMGLRLKVMNAILETVKTDSIAVGPSATMSVNDRYKALLNCLVLLDFAEGSYMVPTVQDTEAARLYNKAKALYDNAVIKLKANEWY